MPIRKTYETPTGHKRAGHAALSIGPQLDVSAFNGHRLDRGGRVGRPLRNHTLRRHSFTCRLGRRALL